MAMRLVNGRQRIWFDEWRGCSPEQLIERWKAYHRDRGVAVMLRRFLEDDLVASLLMLLRACEPPHPVARQRCAELVSLLSGLETSRDPLGDLEKIQGNARVQGAGTAKTWDDPHLYEQLKDAFDKLRRKIQKACNLLAWDGDGAEPAAIAGMDLLNLCIAVRDRYQQVKMAAAALDFDDLLVRTRDLLASDTHRELRRRIARRTVLLLVDEFQDTDEVQADLISALCDGDIGSGKLFLVGDAKQSIYRFRGANPQVFKNLRERLPAAGQLPLTENFRSQPAILNFVNAVFRDDIADYEPLSPTRPQQTPEPAVELLIAPAEAPQETVERMRQREADWIARRLRKLLDDKAEIVCQRESDGTWTPRELRLGDIAFLFRALSDVEHYEAALRRHGIDYYLVGGKAFYSQQEVFDLINLLRAIVYHGDEVSLAGALRSPFFSLSDETLFWLAQREGSLAAGLFSARMPGELDAEQQRRAEYARDTMTALRERKDRLPISELIQEALARTSYDAVLVTEFLGDRKLANLRKLIDMARGFDRSGLFTLADFITQLSQFVAKQPDEALAATHTETSDVVRMMTIHQAKGLEFGLVVVPDLERPQRGTGAEGVAFDRQLGPLVRMPKGSPGHDLICGFEFYHQREALEDAAEITRLFYVAVTRAADYLILSTSMKDPLRPTSSWMKLLARRFDLASGEFCGECVDGFPTPKIAVTCVKPPDRPKSRKPSGPIDWSKVAQRVRAAKEAAPPLHIAPLSPSTSRPPRYSFSRLTGELASTTHDEDDLAVARGTAWDSPIDPLGFGSLVHAVLAEIHETDELDVAARAQHHAEILLQGEATVVEEAATLVHRFLASERGQAIRRARHVYTELEFLLDWPRQSGGGAIHLHGFIDCLYQDSAGCWHVIDYKTNRVTAAQVAHTAGKYELQMLVYGIAVEQIFGQPPESLVLHFLYPGCEHPVRLDDQGRRRAGALIETALKRIDERQTPLPSDVLIC
jgi:ATP-dependent helicase/nuclease subunit A